MQIGLITLFPEMFNFLKYGVVGRALERRLLTLFFWNPRDYTLDLRRTVDDRPYGGGPGMIMKFEPLQAALTAAKSVLGRTTKVIHLSPQGKLLTQSIVAEQICDNQFILIAGRYEGIDERLIEAEVDEEWSIGDYIVSGGELPAMVLIDAITRLLPGTLGHADSASQDSFTSGFLDFPHYTRPEKIINRSVPETLLSGNHAAIARWRLKQSLGRTWQRRRDLLQMHHSLTKNEQELLDEFIMESS
ncbi:tRNA (guanosine(37)-N1)-methyltransferase TrmD [Coxiella endosymbiont of Amblyomma nuttalli]|uniref:tRNA (guanosine(37)-N1)-methyltransferase TrmD n=1 Tax=Coxiella endosymbiont of Amblyomma nuttalli TaxID=2749996 RepID=UPI001BA50388|nr:tRNA (guanosine(37)-N1)-methyltransferase TrmD [Coxiella endosymbiont of Amblyomma nuttalli]QTS83993.1 tRNA (guanine-N(1)-)-methyltransferase [Coxiella endosymbiont of Amblyomma nuttalli]